MLGYQFFSNSPIDSKHFSLNYNTVVIYKCVKTDMLYLKFVWKYKRPIRPKTT